MTTRAGLGALFLAALMALSACGDDDGGQSTAPSGGATADVKRLSAELDRDYKGTYKPPPSTGPAATPGKKIWWISIAQSQSVPALAAKGAVDAGKELGWDVKVFDGQFDTNRIQGGIRQAIAADADAIGMYAVDCAPVQAALETAKRAGVPVLGAEAADCEKPLYTHRVGYVEGTFEEWIFALGRALGVWTAVKSNGTGKTISLSEKGLVATERYQDGYVEGYEECSGCELYVTAYTGADLGPKLQATVEQALLQHPDANFIEGSYDGPITLSVIPALRAAGKLDAFGLIGGEGSPPFMKVVRDRTGMDAGYGTAIEWEAYAMLDNMNRIFTGEQPVDDSGIGVQVYDKTHNTPPSGGYQPPIDYRASFLKIWNGG